jgi:formylmethanofuran dehydrogenase subunit E
VRLHGHECPGQVLGVRMASGSSCSSRSIVA